MLRFLTERGEKMASVNVATSVLPGTGLDLAKMPGHWVLAQMGKRVLRPGGLELTRKMLDALRIAPVDDVVEFAPGMGVTARRVLALRPKSYTGVERDVCAVKQVGAYLHGDLQRCVRGSAEATGLADGAASVVYGEALLTMQTPSAKQQIVREAFRVLRSGGRYGIHEIALIPDAIDEFVRWDIERDLKSAIRVGARPLTAAEWRSVLEAAGFEVSYIATAPMTLLEPLRMLHDEGPLGVARILANLARNPVARQRILTMRRTFRKHAQHMEAITIVARKP